MFHACQGTKLCPIALGVAFGVTEGLLMMLFAWVAAYTGIGVSAIEHFSGIYHGYAPSLVGGLWGGLWGLIVGYIFGAVVGTIYNCTISCCRKAVSSEEKKPDKIE